MNIPAAAPPPPGPSAPPPSSNRRTHPLAVVSLVLSILGFFPLIIIGGLLGAPLGAIALGAIRRDPERLRGNGLAGAGIAIGMVSGVLVLATFGVVRADDWGWLPFAITVAYGGVVLGLAFGAHTRGARTGTAVALGTAGIVAVVMGVVALVVVVTMLFALIGESFIDAILGRD